MSSLFLDPFIFACPIEGDEAVLTSYLTNIVNWHELKELRWPRIYTTAETRNILEQENSYPPYPFVRDLIRRHQIEDIDAHDIETLINALLANGASLEDVTGILELDHQISSLEPDDIFSDRSAGYQRHTLRLLALIGVFGRESDNVGFHFLSRITPISPVELKVDGVVTEILALEADKYTCPLKLKYKILIHGKYECLIEHIDVVNLWLTASTEDEYRACLHMALFQYMHAANIFDKSHLLTTWCFGGEFLNAARDAGAMSRTHSAELLLKACSEVVLGINLNKTHALRETHHPTSKQRLRGSDKAWRRDLDYEYHLHYWETSNGPEFGHVGVHNDFHLPR